jgi:hypothetical protein
LERLKLLASAALAFKRRGSLSECSVLLDFAEDPEDVLAELVARYERVCVKLGVEVYVVDRGRVVETIKRWLGDTLELISLYEEKARVDSRYSLVRDALLAEAGSLREILRTLGDQHAV